MILPELGHFAVCMALCLAIIQAVFPLWGAQTRNLNMMAIARPAAIAQFIFLLFGYAILTHAFLNNDFSVAYVANNSNSKLPLIYQISGVWGAHEGSMLLWIVILGAWSCLVAFFSRSLPDVTVARVLGILGLISIGFLCFLLFTSNPFERWFPAPADGADLNPLLQDPGMAVHPPMLYMGYVGFAVPFAFAIAALLEGRLDAAWARWSRPWTIMAWMFLTVGIALGSWWAYYELGWGGWWFWDPVENASFMPWLVGTALMHSLAVTEKRGLFRGWTVLLAILAFSLSLLGTFLVRSGVLTSVHAFATDPTRGLFILAFLGLVIGGSFLLYAFRMQTLQTRGEFKALSRETFLLLNNVFLVAAAACILLGTLYPLIIDALGQGKISVGAPYFNAVFTPLMLPLFFLLGLGPIIRWREDSSRQLWVNSRTFAIVSVLLTLIGVAIWIGLPSALLFLGLLSASWIIVFSVGYLTQRLKNRSGFAAWRSISAGVYGMVLAHIGLALVVIGVALSNAFSLDHDIRMAPGDEKDLAGYTFRFDALDQVPGPNYMASIGRFSVFRGGELIAEMHPEKRVYQVRRNMMTEAAIDSGLTRDLYISLGEPLDDNSQAWAVRLYYKPFISWIWLGCLVMSLGGIFAAADRRYRSAALKQRQRQQKQVLNDTLAKPV